MLLLVSLAKAGIKKNIFLKTKKKIIGYQGVSTNANNKHHNFSRISPKGAYFQKWNKFTPLLKVKWYWNEIYKEIFKLLNKIPKKNYKIIKIEDFSYKDYLMLSKWIGIKPDINEFFFNFKVKFANKNYKGKKKRLKEFSKFKSNIEKKFYKENIYKKF